MCRIDVRVGLGGEANWNAHTESNLHRQRVSASLQSNVRSIASFFGKPRTSAPATTGGMNRLSLKPPAPLRSHPSIGATINSKEVSGPVPPSSRAYDLVQQIRDQIPHLPISIPVATVDDALATFSCDPHLLIDDPDESWMAINKTLHSALGWDTPVEQLMKIVRRGVLGIEGFVVWIESCLRDVGIDGSLLEGRLERMLAAVQQL